MKGQLKLKPEYKQKLLKALDGRSYKKGKSALNSNNKWCCIGVFADVCLKLKWEPVNAGSYTMIAKDPENPNQNRIGYLSPNRIPMELQRQMAAVNDRYETWAPVKEWIEDNL